MSDPAATLASALPQPAAAHSAPTDGSPDAAPAADFLTDTSALTAPIVSPTDGKPAYIPGKHGGRLLPGGKPGPRKQYNRNTTKAALKQLTGELLGMVSDGIASTGQLAQLVRQGNPRAIETAARLLETVHDRAYGKPVQANVLQDDDGSAAGPQRVVQIGNVSITF